MGEKGIGEKGEGEREKLIFKKFWGEGKRDFDLERENVKGEIGENIDHIVVVVTKTTTEKCKFDTEFTFFELLAKLVRQRPMTMSHRCSSRGRKAYTMKLNLSGMYLKSIERTCKCSPSQFHIVTTDGHGNTFSIYTRYRWGILEATISNGEVDDDIVLTNGFKFYEKRLGGEYDGYIGEAEVIKRLGLQ